MSEVGNGFFKYVERSDVVQMKLAFTNNLREHYFGECFAKHSSESAVLPTRIIQPNKSRKLLFTPLDELTSTERSSEYQMLVWYQSDIQGNLYNNKFVSRCCNVLQIMTSRHTVCNVDSGKTAVSGLSGKGTGENFR
jgi:hypothetical protein